MRSVAKLAFLGLLCIFCFVEAGKANGSANLSITIPVTVDGVPEVLEVNSEGGTFGVREAVAAFCGTRFPNEGA